MSRAFSLRVLRGNASPSSYDLREGVPLDPMSVGQRGALRIADPGVADVVGYLFFDGGQLHLQSHDVGQPVLANGRPVATTWTPFPAPVSVVFGSIELRFEEVGANDATEPRVPQPVAARPFVPGAFASPADDESTRFAPAAQPSAGAVRPAAGARVPPPSDDDDENGPATRFPGQPASPEIGPTRALPAIPSGSAPFVQPGPGASGAYVRQGPQAFVPPGYPPAGAPPVGAQAGASGTNTVPPPNMAAAPVPSKGAFHDFMNQGSPLRRFLFVALPGVIIIMLLRQHRFQREQAENKLIAEQKAALAASASALASASAAASGAPKAPVIGVILGAQILTPPPPPAPSADPKDKKKKDDGEQYATPATSAKTLDRQAVDAMMDGKLPEALKIYRQLAAQKPKDPTYSSAVKVLEEKGIK